MRLFFYELHEGAGDLLANALLVSEQEWAPEEFRDAVLAARARVLESFEEDSLSEAIARELERAGHFTYIADEKLRASMSVGIGDKDTYSVDLTDEFRSVVVELDPS
jgi:hypothetical protein